MRKYIILNTVAATAGDLTTPGQGVVKVTGDLQGFKRGDVDEIAVLPFVNETLEIVRVTAAAAPAANTTYQFTIEQTVLGKKKQALVSYFTGATTPSASAFGIAITAVLQGLINSNQLEVSAVAHATGNGGVDITALTGYAVFYVKQLSGVVAASTLATATSSGNLSASGTTITMAQNPTAAFTVGSLVKLSGWTGTAVINGRTAAQGVTLRVATIVANTNVTFTASTVTGSITAAVTTYALIASQSRGLGQSFIDLGFIAGGSPSVSVVAANAYHEVVVKGGSFAGKSMAQEDLAPLDTRYLISSTASAANALLLLARFVEVKNYFGPGVTTVDPLLLD